MKDKRFENRYLTLKLKDVKKYLTRDQQEQLEDLANAVADGRKLEGKDSVEGIFIEQDWPEYKDASNALCDRINGLKVKTLAQLINGCMGYIENGTSISLCLSQDDATKYFSLCAVDCGEVLWRENETNIDMLFRAAYLKHAEKF